MDDTTEIRIAKVDARLTHFRGMRLAAEDACHEAERETYELEIDRLLEVRLILTRGGLIAGLPLDLETQ